MNRREFIENSLASAGIAGTVTPELMAEPQSPLMPAIKVLMVRELLQEFAREYLLAMSPGRDEFKRRMKAKNENSDAIDNAEMS